MRQDRVWGATWCAVMRGTGSTLSVNSCRSCGILKIVTLRIVPVAPFVVINLVAGASHISFRDFALGTLIGLLPGLLAIAFFADGLIRSIRDPNVGSIAWLGAVILMIAGATLWLRKWQRGRQDATGSRADA